MDLEQSLLKANQQAMECLNEGDASTALRILQNAEAKIQQCSQEKFYKKLINITYNNLGCYYKRINNFQQALIHLKKAASIDATSTSEVINKAGSYLNICAILSSQNDHNLALEHARKAMMMLQEASVNNGGNLSLVHTLIVAYHNMGVEYEILKINDLAIEHYKSGFDLAKKKLPKGHQLISNLKRSLLQFRFNNMKTADAKKRSLTSGRTLSSSVDRAEVDHRSETSISNIKPKDNRRNKSTGGRQGIQSQEMSQHRDRDRVIYQFRQVAKSQPTVPQRIERHKIRSQAGYSDGYSSSMRSSANYSERTSSSIRNSANYSARQSSVERTPKEPKNRLHTGNTRLSALSQTRRVRNSSNSPDRKKTKSLNTTVEKQRTRIKVIALDKNMVNLEKKLDQLENRVNTVISGATRPKYKSLPTVQTVSTRVRLSHISDKSCREETAATLIQKCWKGYQIRYKYVAARDRHRRETAIAERALRCVAELEQIKKVENFEQMTQIPDFNRGSILRNYRDQVKRKPKRKPKQQKKRRTFTGRHQKAIVIQTQIRRWLAQRKYERKKAAALIIQKHMRGYQSRNLYEQITAATVYIQRMYRLYLEIKDVKKLKM